MIFRIEIHTYFTYGTIHFNKCIYDYCDYTHIDIRMMSDTINLIQYKFDTIERVFNKYWL